MEERANVDITSITQSTTITSTMRISMILCSNTWTSLRQSQVSPGFFKIIYLFSWLLGESKAEGKLRINLYLRTQILEEADALIKCEHCLAPVTSKMIPEVKFKAIFDNRDYVLAQGYNLDDNTREDPNEEDNFVSVLGIGSVVDLKHYLLPLYRNILFWRASCWLSSSLE